MRLVLVVAEPSNPLDGETYKGRPADMLRQQAGFFRDVSKRKRLIGCLQLRAGEKGDEERCQPYWSLCRS